MADFEFHAVQNKLDEIGRRFRDALPERVARIVELGGRVAGGERGALPEFRHSVHTLAGAAGTFGHHYLSRRASQLESELGRPPEPGSTLDTAWRKALAESIKDLQKTSAVMVSGASATAAGEESKTATDDVQPAASDGEQRIYLLEDDPDQAEYLASELEMAGVSTKIFADAEALRIAVIENRPSAIVADIELPDARDGGLEIVASLKRTVGPSLPVVFASARSDAQTRLRALRAGGDAFFAKPVDTRALRARLAELAAGHRHEESLQIVIVEDDDDQAAAAAAAATLESHGMQVRVLDGALASMDELLATSPDVIVMDMHLPDTSGLDLARIIRQEERFLMTPIVFLTADRSIQTRQAVFSNSGFDLLVKPMNPTELVSLVRVRGREQRTHREKLHFLGRVDPVTGLANARYLEMALDAGQKSEGRRSVIVVMIELGELHRRYPSIDALHLHLAKAAGQLRKVVPTSWLLAYLGEGCFAATGAVDSRDTLERHVQSMQATVDDCRDGGFERILISGAGAVLLESKEAGNRGLAEAYDLAHRAVQSGGGYRLAPSQSTPDTRPSWAKWMRQILQERDLTLLYQPLASAQGENCSYFELSVRKRSAQNARLELPMPSERDAQTVGVREELDLIVLANACRILARRAIGSTFFVPVAVSTVAKPGFTKRLKFLLAKQGTQAASLCLELAEPELLNSPQTSAWLDELRALQIRLAFTDLGATAFTEKLFKRMRPDIVKVGRGLVRDLCGEESAARERAKILLRRIRECDTPIIGAYVDDIATLRALWKESVSYLLGDFVCEADTSMAEGFHVQMG